MDHIIPTYTQAFNYEKLTVDDTAGGKALTASKYQSQTAGAQATTATKLNAKVAFITADGTAGTNDVRYTLDGTAPVATTTGHLLKAGQTLELKGYGNIVKFRAIREGGSSGTLQVTYFV